MKVVMVRWCVCRRLSYALRKPYLVISYNGHWLNCIGWILIINNNGYARRRFRVDGWGWFSHLNGYLCFSFWSISLRKTVVTHLGYYYNMCKCVCMCLQSWHTHTHTHIRIGIHITDAIEATRFYIKNTIVFVLVDAWCFRYNYVNYSYVSLCICVFT